MAGGTCPDRHQLQWVVFGPGRNVVARCLHARLAAVVAAAAGTGSVVHMHRLEPAVGPGETPPLRRARNTVLWHEGREGFSGADYPSRAERIMLDRHNHMHGRDELWND